MAPSKSKKPPAKVDKPPAKAGQPKEGLAGPFKSLPLRCYIDGTSSFPEPWSITDVDQERVPVDATGMRVASLNPHLMDMGILDTSFASRSARQFAKALAKTFPWPWSVVEVGSARAYTVIDANAFRLVHVYFAPSSRCATAQE